ncbi:MAG TPA: PilZ domain-containing protein [Phycisphaerales bacterium]|jgi:hypothetical protein|nr:PilZ domain-containing protein [Phycisphaerales bacterium]
MSLFNEKQEPSRNERRTAGRITCSHTKCQFGEVTNLSKGGCRVVAKRPVDLPEGRSVNLQIKAAGASMVVPACLVSCRQRADGRYEHGFQFVGITDEMRREIIMFARAAADNESLRMRNAA